MMRSILLGLALSGWMAGSAFAQCVPVSCPVSGDANMVSSSTTSSSSSTSTSSSTNHVMNGSEQSVSHTVTLVPESAQEQTSVASESHARGSHHAHHQKHVRKAYRHGYRDGYRNGYADRGKSKARANKSRPRAAAPVTSHRRTGTSAKKSHVRAPVVNNHVHANRPFVDVIKDRASSYKAASSGSVLVLSEMSSASSSSSTSSSSTSATSSWSTSAMPMQHEGQNCGWRVQTFVTPDGQSTSQQVWVCQCPQNCRPPGY